MKPERPTKEREALVTAQALACFVAIQKHLPFELRDTSTARDAEAILAAKGLADIFDGAKYKRLAPFTIRPDAT